MSSEYLPIPANDGPAGERRYLCIHAHLYQPPRENPWLETIEEQPIAGPFHDWNARITSECYGPNTAARITDHQARILDIRNNYEQISFNIGPTLFSWLEEHAPMFYEEILAADARSAERRGGHGNAVAQVYNHVIMPLQTARDKHTQILWGMEDFRARFRRDPEGMWLAETAADTDSLEALADNGIKYTILAPRQAKAWRELDGTGGWRRGGIDPTRPYLCSLPSGRSIVLFFYDGPISQGVAFEGLLNNGEAFADRLASGFSRARRWPQLMHIATDGESYGHHHRHGEMALAYALHNIEKRNLAALTNYGEYLSLVTPTCEAQIWEESSWSCVHGVERWRSDCGCNSGGRPGWNQAWRGPLRAAYDIVKEKADEVFGREGERYFDDPWKARDAYINVLLDRDRVRVKEFLATHTAEALDAPERKLALRLLEMQRHSMLMYTSCAWFFDEVSGLETTQTMKYASRVLQLIAPYEPDLEDEFLAELAKAPSNIPEYGNGGEVYQRFIKPQEVDLSRVAANYALMNFDQQEAEATRQYCFDIVESEPALAWHGNARIKMSRLSVRNRTDGDMLDAVACVLHYGGHDFQCALATPFSSHDYKHIREEIFQKFQRGSLAEVLRTLDHYFGGRDYKMSDMFGECQRELLARVTQEGFVRFDSALAHMYDDNRKLMGYLLEVGAPTPKGFLAVAEYVLRSRLRDELEQFTVTENPARAMELAEEAQRLGTVHVVDETLLSQLTHILDQVFRRVAMAPLEENCRLANQVLDIVELLNAPLDLWEPQNIVFALVHDRVLPVRIQRQKAEATSDRNLRDLFDSMESGGRPRVMPELRALADRLKIAEAPLRREPAKKREVVLS